jgi:glycerol-3-phosphate dehydrogenase (NAD(P)+)
MGTAFAMHSARLGNDTHLWANPHDLRAYATLLHERKHPLLPEYLPSDLVLHGPNELREAASGCDVAVMGANSHGARSLAQMVQGRLDAATFIVSVAKGLEPETGRRISEIYSAELPGPCVISVGGPCLAGELAEGLPTAGVWAAVTADDAARAGKLFEDRHYQLAYTDDVVGVELCSMMKNVAAIGLGMLDGLGKPTSEDFKNAKAALFTRAAHELAELVTALGGRRDTVYGLAGLGDQLVTSLGGRNRLFGEMVGAGDPPEATLAELESRGMTVEGVDSTRDVQRLAQENQVEIPFHAAIHRVLFEGAHPREVLEVLR